jgi:putative ABC transport system permease protein
VIALLNHIGMPNWLGSPKISYSVVIATISILALLGFLAGYFPAKRASKMDPVEALGK